jgi:hypothetical protein
MKTKYCPKCNQEKNIIEFDININRKGGLSYCCKLCKKIYNKLIYITKKEIYNMNSRNYYKNHSKEIIESKKLYRKINKIKIREKAKLKYQKNKEKILLYEINKRKTDINYRLAGNMRKRLRIVLKSNPKLSTTMKLIGCSAEQLKKHLESKFKQGMSWSNYGKWHIDHILPCASFDLSKPEEQRKCFHYTNLQPLWAKENLSKGNRIIKEN